MTACAGLGLLIIEISGAEDRNDPMLGSKGQPRNRVAFRDIAMQLSIFYQRISIPAVDSITKFV